MKKIIFLVSGLILLTNVLAQQSVEQWKVFEITLKGPITENPFTDTKVSATFQSGTTSKTVEGFYDGAGIYKIRFMPRSTGTWTYVTQSNQKALQGKKGKFICTNPSTDNHGPVEVKDTFYLAYADGTPHYSFGTTCYGWVHQGDSLASQTLNTLSNGYFNKMRMCIFPKDYDWNKNEPLFYPFEGKPLKDWDYSRFNPQYFRNIEKRILQLDSLGIEADLIVFHPYDRWGFKTMNRETDERYVRYIIARFAAYKNVWWSMANEFDFMEAKKMEDWDHIISVFANTDPYQHLIGIHNGAIWYDHTNPYITHASIQNEETHKAKEWRLKYQKPVVLDECRYEGNIPWSWGNLTGREMVNKFWRGVTNGGFVGHGETYVNENPAKWPSESDAVLWWSKGGVMSGESHPRIKFLKEITESAPGFLRPCPLFPSWMPFSAVSVGTDYYLAYFNMDQPASTVIELPANNKYTVEVIDAWEMSIKKLEGTFSGKSLIVLPQKPMTALRIIATK